MGLLEASTNPPFLPSSRFSLSTSSLIAVGSAKGSLEPERS
jgi:hypothetical protein